MGKTHKKKESPKSPGGRSSGGSSKQQKQGTTHRVAENDDNEHVKVTMEELKAMSDSDDDSGLPPEEEWDASARSLKQAIERGAFNKLFRKKKDPSEEEEESIEEVVLGDEDKEDDDDEESEEEEEDTVEKKKAFEEDEADDNDSSERDDDDDEESESDSDDNNNEAPRRNKAKLEPSEKKQQSTRSPEMDEKEDESGESENDSDSEEDRKPSAKEAQNARSSDESGDEENAIAERKEDEDEEARGEQDDGFLSIKQLNATRQKSLRAVADDLLGAQERLTWPETFDVVSSSPLPFGKPDEEGDIVDIHDDLKREVTFYNTALEAAIEGRRSCEDADIPFSRPENFFAEMVKTDEHMAKIKDRLIFENKKIEAVNQRKANKEQKLRAKESHANKLAEKARRRKDNLKAVDDWARTAASQRGSGRLNDSDDFPQRSPQPNKKRMAANKRWGFGGKKGRFKQTDPKKLNDMSGFSPKGNFAGGRKRAGGPSGGSQKRPGKRAREASRSRR